MKNLVLAIAMLFSMSMIAQNTNVEPKFEVESNMVKATYFHDNGVIAQTGYYLNGKLHGEWKSFDENGDKIAIGEYENGKKTGKWFFWNGDNLNEVNYSDSRIASVRTWSESAPLVINK